MAKKFLSALLAVLMVISIVPMTAMADGGTNFPQSTPTVVAGVSANETAMEEAVAKALGVQSVSVTDAGSGNPTNLLWFAMAGLGSTVNYSLSVKDTDGNELLGEKYVTTAEQKRIFQPGANKTKYLIYVSLNNASNPDANTGKVDNQVNAKALGNKKYTVTLTRDDTKDKVAETSITLFKDSNNVWTGTPAAVSAGDIVFKKPEATSYPSPVPEGKVAKNVGDLYTGTPEFKVTADGTNKWKVAVTGVTLKYVSGYTGFHSLDREQHGYYIAVSIPRYLKGYGLNKMVAGGRKTDGTTTEKIWTHTSTEFGTIDNCFSEYTNTYCDIFIYLGETAEEIKAKTGPTYKLTYGTMDEQTFTLDVSGLTFPDETVKAEALDKNIQFASEQGKPTNELQTDIVATADPETKTIKVTGTSYDITTPWTAFDGREGKNTGHFVALKFTNKAGVPMKLYSPTQKGTADEWKTLTDGEVVTRLENLKEDGYKGKIRVGANDPKKEGTEWTIDYTGVFQDVLTDALKVDALNGTVYGKKGSDLQSDIITSRKKNGDVTTVYVRGNSKYVTDYTLFSSKDTEQEGNYVALKLTSTGAIKIGNTEYDGSYVVLLNGSKNYKTENVTVTRTVDGKQVVDKYILDFTGVTRLPADILKAEKKAAGSGVSTLEGLSVSYDKTSKKIVLSGRVEPKTTNQNLFSDADITVTYGTDATDAAKNATKDVRIRFVKDGDTLKPDADPATVAGNTLSFDTSMLVIKKADTADKADTTAPKAEASKDIPEEQKKAAEEVAKALAGTGGAEIEGTVLKKYADVLANEADKKETLVAEAAKIVASNDKVPQSLKANIEYAADGGVDAVTTVVQTYAKIEVVGITNGTTAGEIASFELSITPMARTIVSLTDNMAQMRVFDPDATTNANANAIAVKDEKVAISESTKVTLALPASYKADKAFITHTKDDGTEYHYTGKIEGSNPRTLSFTSTHGFSSFTISSTESAASKDASLKTLKVGSTDAVVTGTATPYTAVATLPKGSDLTKQTLTLAATNANAKITVNGNAYTAGMTVDLSASKTVNIAVTAEDGTTKATYALTAKLSTGEPSDEYHDIPSGGMGDWVKSAINYGLMSNIGKNADGKLTFGPIESVLRKEFAVMVARADVIAKNADIKDKDAADKYLKDNYISEKLSFSDIAGQADTYIAAIEYCKKNDIIAGYENGTFRPNAKVSRTEAASMVVGWLKLDDTNKTNPSSFKDWSKVGWAQGKVNAVVAAGIMKGESDTEFGTGELTRQQIAVIIVRSYRKVAGITVTE